MNRLFRGLFIAVFVLAAVAGASAQSADISFENHTGATIFFLYASPPTADSWGQDLLGKTVLPDGGTFRARIYRTNALDVRAVDANDNQYIIWNWQVRGDRIVYITPETHVGVTLDASPLSWLNIRNETHYTIEQIIVVPTGPYERHQVQEFLEPWEGIHHGEEYRVEIDPDPPEISVFDVILVDEDGDRYLREAVDIRTEVELVFTLDDLLRR